jgi:outer membrane protein OmpA-like peptidoglycan-associated protein
LKKTSKTGKDGKITYELKFNTCDKFAASFEGYEPNTKEGCVKGAESANDITVVEIPLSKEFKYKVEGVVFDQSNGLPLPGATVQLLGGKDTSTVTDASGRYSFPLEKYICYKLRGEKDKYLAVSTEDTVCTKGLTEDKTYLVNLNLQPTTVPAETVAGTDPNKNGNGTGTGTGTNPTTGGNPVAGGNTTGAKPPKGGFEVSPTVPIDGTISYLLHIYYDFDQAYIRDESNPELKKLKKMMTDNPNYIIEIASHTDARGSDSYNNRLSQRRAEAVVRWLVKQGLERDRLVPRGYGESMTSNKCVNLIPCTEKEHQMNRRTEFRVLGCKGCTEEKLLSKPNEKAKVDKCQGCPF